MAIGSKTVILAALVGNALIAVTKFIAATITGSSAMFSEGIHSLVDTGNQVLLLYGMKRAARPANPQFPFGHGKEIYFWSFSVAILIFGLGAGISIYEGISHLKHPEPIQQVHVNYIVLGLAIIFEGAAWTVAWRAFSQARGNTPIFEAIRHGKDPTLFVVLFEDSAAMLGLLIALAGVSLSYTTQNPIFDGLASILIGVVLAITAVYLARETKGLLIGEAASRRVVDGVRELVNTHASVQHVNEVLTMHVGPNFVLLNLSVEFDDAHTADDIEKAVQTIDQQIKRQFKNIKRVFIEAEARRPKTP